VSEANGIIRVFRERSASPSNRRVCHILRVLWRFGYGRGNELSPNCHCKAARPKQSLLRWDRHLVCH